MEHFAPRYACAAVRTFDSGRTVCRIGVCSSCRAPLERRQATQSIAEVAELADAHGSGPCTRKGVGVRVPSSAPVILLTLQDLAEPGFSCQNPRWASATKRVADTKAQVLRPENPSCVTCVQAIQEMLAGDAANCLRPAHDATLPDTVVSIWCSGPHTATEVLYEAVSRLCLSLQVRRFPPVRRF
jgi:hypothetical protein